jgi:hypothetical protein
MGGRMKGSEPLHTMFVDKVRSGVKTVETPSRLIRALAEE